MYDLRRRVNALRRKLAIPLAIVRLRRLAQEFCLQSTVARAERQPPPGSHPFIRRVVDAGFRLPTFMAVSQYLERCRTQNIIPDSYQLLRSLIPWAPAMTPFYDTAGR